MTENLIHFSFRINTTDCLLKIVALSNVVLNMIRFLKLLDAIELYALRLRTKTLNYFQNLISIRTGQEVWCYVTSVFLSSEGTLIATEISAGGGIESTCSNLNWRKGWRNQLKTLIIIGFTNGHFKSDIKNDIYLFNRALFLYKDREQINLWKAREYPSPWPSVHCSSQSRVQKYFLSEFQILFSSHLATLWIFIIIKSEPAGFQLDCWNETVWRLVVEKVAVS